MPSMWNGRPPMAMVPEEVVVSSSRKKSKTAASGATSSEPTAQEGKTGLLIAPVCTE